MKNQDIRLGDKVKFLNDVGGGHVTRIEGKIIYVEDEIGFEVPMPSAEVVVVERLEEPSQEEPVPVRSPLIVNKVEEEKSVTIEDDEFVEEEPQHDDNNPRIYLAFLDAGIKDDVQTVDLHLVNDSNYHCLFLFAEMGEDGLAREVFNGRIPANTKEYLGGFPASKLDSKWMVQLILYKRDKPYQLFDPLNQTMKIRAEKFFKEKGFKENDFFYEKAVMMPLIKNELERQMENLSKKETSKALKEKGEFKIKNEQPVRKKRTDIIEVDLHIHELLDDTRGLSNADMLKLQVDRFHEVIRENEKNKGQKIVFIHGIGNGTLKHEVRRLLNTRYKKHNFQDASFREYGYGATMVII
ncbi:DUF2027 domain-containing protein [Marinilabilia rubra]|uniref:DUF2027 domain-containing protein n=1 Tax=Marinilabilia rubra TaxID=2162893 RepID=A0A2U2BCE2_9BACT|nr:DUF2027 domain-containing protein [Marinilabilia rubra]PWE00746.1 DUF2027 domain-containing protein [Marinilabilia rubra]